MQVRAQGQRRRLRRVHAPVTQEQGEGQLVRAAALLHELAAFATTEASTAHAFRNKTTALLARVFAIPD